MYTNSDDCKRGSTIDRCSWSNPIAISINSDGTANSKDQWEPAIHVSNITSASKPRGTIHITALDRREDTNNIQWKVWHYSCSPGATLGCRTATDWGNVVVSDEAIHNRDQSFIGDYHGITNIGTKEAYTVWSDSRNFGSPNNLDFDVMGDWTPR